MYRLRDSFITVLNLFALALFKLLLIIFALIFFIIITVILIVLLPLQIILQIISYEDDSGDIGEF